MSKTLIVYPAFVIVALLVAAAFITATSYTQLGVAIIFYPLLAFFAYKIFLDKNPAATLTGIHPKVEEKITTQNNPGIADIDKRAFLKLLGATGISFFLISIFGHRIESLIFGRQNNAAVLPAKPPISSGGSGSNSASPTDGYNISEVDDGIIAYYGFINNEGNWFIMKGDTNTGSFRYTKGKSNFPDNWKKRQNLSYDYFYKVFSQN